MKSRKSIKTKISETGWNIFVDFSVSLLKLIYSMFNSKMPASK